MSAIEPVRTDIDHPNRNKKYSSPLRLWHWANAIVISGSLITVLINSTVLDRSGINASLKENLDKATPSFTDTQLRPLIGVIRDRVWDVHVYFGYALASLFLFRLILEFFELADQKFIRKMKSAYIKFNTTKKNREIARHELTVKIIYTVFYALLLMMALTGLSLAFEDVAIFKHYRHGIKSVHSFGMYVMLAFITVHLIGVFLAERKNSKGIVSDMINGGNENQ